MPRNFSTAFLYKSVDIFQFTMYYILNFLLHTKIRSTGLSAHLAPFRDGPTYRLLALKPQQTIYLVLR